MLRGIGVSKGVARGVARIVLDPSDFAKFRDGEVLVTIMTNPGMTSIMAKASAIVCDIGGMTSHASILAREMGIPCVVNTKNATTLLKNGQDVFVNGTTGEVTIGTTTLAFKEEKIGPKLSNKYTTRKSQDWIDSFVNETLKTIGEMDFRTLAPFSSIELEVLFYNEFLNNFSKVVTPTTVKNLASFRGKVSPGTISDHMLLMSVMLKSAKWPREKRLELMEFLYKAVKQLHAGDVFVSNEQNLALTEEEVQQALSGVKFQKSDETIAKKLGQLYSALYHLSNGFYTDMYMGICIQNYGPYGVSKKFGAGHELVIKNAFNLKPHEIWPEVAQLPFGEVKIYCVYENVKFKTDLFSCHSRYDGDPIKGLRFWAVEADGEMRSFEEVKEIAELYTRLSDQYWTKITSLPFEELKQKGVLIKQFALKPLFDAAEINWEPTSEMKQAVKNKLFSLPEALKMPTSNKEHWRKILDPRIDFTF